MQDPQALHSQLCQAQPLSLSTESTVVPSKNLVSFLGLSTRVYLRLPGETVGFKFGAEKEQIGGWEILCQRRRKCAEIGGHTPEACSQVQGPLPKLEGLRTAEWVNTWNRKRQPLSLQSENSVIQG